MRRNPQLHQLRIAYDLRVGLGHGRCFVGWQILLQDVPGFVHNRVFGADTLFIRTKNRVGAQSAQFVPGDTSVHSRTHRVVAPELARTASRPRGSPIAHRRKAWPCAIGDLVENPDAMPGVNKNHVFCTDALFIRTKTRLARAARRFGLFSRTCSSPAASHRTSYRARSRKRAPVRVRR